MKNEPNSSGLMDTALRAAVPMWLLELHGRDIDYLQKRAGICSQAITEKGDVLMYGSKKPGAAGEVFNRLAEGMACLLLITKHPVPFSTMVFHHDGRIERFETEEEANRRVWPEMSSVQEADSGSLQSKKMRAMRKTSSKDAGLNSHKRADKKSKGHDR